MPAWDMVVVSVDAAFKAGDEDDYVAIHKSGFFARRRGY